MTRDIIQKVQESLRGVECHFKWEPCRDDKDACPETSIDHITDNLEGGYPCKEQMLLLIGYLHTQTEPPDLDRAIEIFDQVIDFCVRQTQQADGMSPDEVLGLRYIAMANKLHTMLLVQDKTQVVGQLQDLLESFRSLDPKEFSNVTLATFKATESQALIPFGVEKQEKSVSLYLEAVRLDPDNPRCLMGCAFIAGRCRRKKEGFSSLPTELEENLLRKGVKLTQEKHSNCIVLLADVLFQKGRSVQGSKPNQHLLDEATMWYQKALALDPESPNVLTRCGKAFHVMGMKTEGLECLEKAVRLDPKSAHSLFRLGQCYGFSHDRRQQEKGLGHLKNAATMGRRRHIWAEIEYGKLKRRLEPGFDLVQYLQDMKAKYPEDQRKQIQQQIEIFKANQIKYAKKKPKGLIDQLFKQLKIDDNTSPQKQ